MATTEDLLAANFVSSEVFARSLNIEHHDPSGLGPYCRLRVVTNAAENPGVYAWVVDLAVSYVGKSSHLLHVVDGARLQRPYNDYTYVPASQASKSSDPRVRINGLLNRAMVGGHDVAWWWLETRTTAEAERLEAQLIDQWDPPWNIARPKIRG